MPMKSEGRMQPTGTTGKYGTEEVQSSKFKVQTNSKAQTNEPRRKKSEISPFTIHNSHFMDHEPDSLAVWIWCLCLNF
jgi:hypothetical protein